MAYNAATPPYWRYGGGGIILQQVTLSCHADGSIGFEFCGWFSGAYYCCSTADGSLIQTSLTCGASPVVTYAYDGVPAPGSSCDIVKNTLGYDNFKVSL